MQTVSTGSTRPSQKETYRYEKRPTKETYIKDLEKKPTKKTTKTNQSKRPINRRFVKQSTWSQHGIKKITKHSAQFFRVHTILHDVA